MFSFQRKTFWGLQSLFMYSVSNGIPFCFHSISLFLFSKTTLLVFFLFFPSIVLFSLHFVLKFEMQFIIKAYIVFWKILEMKDTCSRQVLQVNLFVLLISLVVYKIVRFWFLLNLTLSDFLRNRTREKKTAFRSFVFQKSFFFLFKALKQSKIIKYILLSLRFWIQSIKCLFLILFTRDVINGR